MKSDEYGMETDKIIQSIGPGCRLVVIGSGSFWGDDSAQICEVIANEMATIEEISVLTGGMEGVGLTFARAYVNARQRLRMPENSYQLLPEGFESPDVGIMIQAGSNLFDRREILGRVGDFYLVIEGGPGTEHEAKVAMSRGVPVIPIGRSGGYAKDLFESSSVPSVIDTRLWNVLGESNGSIVDLANAVKSIFHLICKRIDFANRSVDLTD